MGTVLRKLVVWLGPVLWRKYRQRRREKAQDEQGQQQDDSTRRHDKEGGE